jgi:chemotaxis response regulator CheB
MAESTTTSTGRETGTNKRHAYDIVVVASSTGGPAALEAVLGGLGADFNLPILVVQHMMPAFTAEFSEWLGRSISLPVNVARHGQNLEAGHVYLAPEDVHLKLVDRGTIGLSSEPKCGYHRPSADVLFESAAEYFGARTLAVVLTGMGRAGLADSIVTLRDMAMRIRVLARSHQECCNETPSKEVSNPS